MKSWIKNTLKFLFALALIVWLVQSGRLDFKSLKSLVQPSIVLGGASLIVICNFFMSERWKQLLDAQGFRLTRFETFKLTMLGIFFNYSMPGGVGGDLVKGFYVVRAQKNRKLEVALTILLDRVFGLYVMVLLAAMAILVGFAQIWDHPQLRLLAVFIGCLAVGCSLGLAAGFSEKLKNMIGPRIPEGVLKKRILQVWQALVIYGRSPKTLLKVFALSALGQFTMIAFYVMIGESLGFNDVPLFYYFIACLTGAMMTAIPISPAGVGVGQAAFAFLFSALMSRDSTLGASLATAGQIGTFVVGLLGAWFYINMKSEIPTTDT